MAVVIETSCTALGAPPTPTTLISRNNNIISEAKREKKKAGHNSTPVLLVAMEMSRGVAVEEGYRRGHIIL